MTVAELSVRMSHREMVEQMVYDKLKKLAEEEAALDARLANDQRAALARLAR